MTQSQHEIPAVGVDDSSGMSRREVATKLWLLGFLLLHVVPLLAGASNFTIFSFWRHPGSFTFSFFDFSYSSGWGYVYQSSYSLWQVLAYLVAYATGVIFYPRLARPTWLAAASVGICLMGLISFAIEASHWVLDHNLSLIASLPIALLLVALWTIGRVMRSA
jgi:hypothetical protein